MTTDTERKLRDALVKILHVVGRRWCVCTCCDSPTGGYECEACYIERTAQEALRLVPPDPSTCPICGRHHIVRDGQPPICVHCECAQIDRRAEGAQP
jgi:hypothetical protein